MDRSPKNLLFLLQMKEGKYDFLPINRAICLETTDKADRMKLSGKKAGEENEVTMKLLTFIDLYLHDNPLQNSLRF